MVLWLWGAFLECLGFEGLFGVDAEYASRGGLDVANVVVSLRVILGIAFPGFVDGDMAGDFNCAGLGVYGFVRLWWYFGVLWCLHDLGLFRLV